MLHASFFLCRYYTVTDKAISYSSFAALAQGHRLHSPPQP